MKAKIMDAKVDSMHTQAEELFARAESISRSQYPLVVTLWVMLLALVMMANPS